MFPSTVERVQNSTSAAVNEEIRRQTDRNIATYRQASRYAIDQRLQELDDEWDIERTLEANASLAVLLGVTLGATVDRRWFFFPAVVAGFLLQHSIQGWCPPLPIFRRLGVRTSSEIDRERRALHQLRDGY